MSAARNFLQSRTRNTFFTSAFVIALVLFLMCLFVTSVVYSMALRDAIKEEYEVLIELPEYTSKDKRDRFESFLSGQEFVKDLRYVSKQDAADMYAEAYGSEAFDMMDGLNPLPASFNIHLKHNWIQKDSLEKMRNILENQDILLVQNIVYPGDEINQLEENIKRNARYTFIAFALVFLVGFFIVNSTVRLAIFGRRLMIRSMQLLGATGSFIKAPFMKMGIFQGLTGAVLAVLGTIFLLLIVSTSQPESLDLDYEILKSITFRYEMVILYGGIIIFGALLGWLSSTWAVSRFMNKNLDQLV